MRLAESNPSRTAASSDGVAFRGRRSKEPEAEHDRSDDSDSHGDEADQDDQADHDDEAGHDDCDAW